MTFKHADGCTGGQQTWQKDGAVFALSVRITTKGAGYNTKSVRTWKTIGRVCLACQVTEVDAEKAAAASVASHGRA